MSSLGMDVNLRVGYLKGPLQSTSGLRARRIGTTGRGELKCSQRRDIIPIVQRPTAETVILLTYRKPFARVYSFFLP